jgi:hypothetical protein
MVNLMLSGMPTGNAVGGIGLLLDAPWRVAHGAGVAGDRDLVSRCVSTDVAWRVGMVWQAAGADTTLGLRLKTKLIGASCRSSGVWVEFRSTRHHLRD